MTRKRKPGAVAAAAGPVGDALEEAKTPEDSPTEQRLQAGRLPLHPVVFEYHDLTADELERLRASLWKVGLLVPVVTWCGQIVDGRHREEMCCKLGLRVVTSDLGDLTEEEMRQRVAALNEHRRARTTTLTTAEKQARIAAALKADPARSDVAIAEEVGVAQSTVYQARKAAEQKGVIEKITPAQRKSRTGKRGEGARKTARSPRPQPTDPNPTEVVESTTPTEVKPTVPVYVSVVSEPVTEPVMTFVTVAAEPERSTAPVDHPAAPPVETPVDDPSLFDRFTQAALMDQRDCVMWAVQQPGLLTPEDLDVVLKAQGAALAERP